MIASSSAIPDRRLGPPALSVPLYRLDDLGIRIQIKPVRETRKLALTFPLPSVDALYDKKPSPSGATLSATKGKATCSPCSRAGAGSTSSPPAAASAAPTSRTLA